MKLETAGLIGAGVIGFICLVFVAAMIVSWPTNVYKLTQCDFKAPYKCEAIRAAGLIPVVSPFIAWVDLGE